MVDSRICNVCKIDKNLQDFHKAKTLPLGVSYTCKVCAKARSLVWNSQNKEKKKLNGQKHYEENKDAYLERAKKLSWAAHNKDKVLANAKERYKAKRELYVSALAKRRAEKLSATPSWLTQDQKEQIKLVYKEATLLQQEHNSKYHVDHIVPLKGKNVCGLHVPWNLRAIPATENIAKGNRILDELETFGY